MNCYIIEDFIDINQWKDYHNMSDICDYCHESFYHSKENIAKVNLQNKETYICGKCANEFYKEENPPKLHLNIADIEPKHLLTKLCDEDMQTILTKIENLEKIINSVIKYMR